MSDAHLLFVVLAAAGSLISAVFGFGTAIILLAGGALFLPVPECIALSTIIFAANTLNKSWIHRHHIDWRLTIQMSLVSLPFAWAGAELMVEVPVDWLRRGLAAIVILHILLQFLKARPAFTPSLSAVIGISGLYGFLSGLIGTGNIIKALFLDRAGFERQSFVGVMAATSVLANAGKLFSYSQSGLFGPQHLMPALALLAVSVITTLAGRHLLTRISGSQFKVGLRLILLVVAVSLLVT